MACCDTCGSEHNGSFGIGRFCNSSCAGIYSNTHRGIKNKLSLQEYDKKYTSNIRKNKVAKAIVWDARSWDKVRGFRNTVSELEASKIISKPCSYCEETNLRMTLDRIDNLKGHSEDNVVGACIRCNLLRKDMPYEAWLEFVPGLRSARIKGLFGKWTGCLKPPVQ